MHSDVLVVLVAPEAASGCENPVPTRRFDKAMAARFFGLAGELAPFPGVLDTYPAVIDARTRRVLPVGPGARESDQRVALAREGGVIVDDRSEGTLDLPTDAHHSHPRRDRIGARRPRW